MWPASAQRSAFFSIQPMTSITALRLAGSHLLAGCCGMAKAWLSAQVAGWSRSVGMTVALHSPSEPFACRSVKVGTSQTPLKWKAAWPALKSATDAG